MIEVRDSGFFVVSSGAFRLHGSAALRATVPAAVSTAILLIYVVALDNSLKDNDEERWVVHPYVIQAIIVAITFVLAFRANFAYGRYWEGATVVHQMLSKWLDVGTLLSSFHYQSQRYDEDRPTAFGSHPNIKFGSRDRQRFHEYTHSQYLDQLPPEPEREKRKWFRWLGRSKQPQEPSRHDDHVVSTMLPEHDAPTTITATSTKVSEEMDSSKTVESSSLFLQELVHLLSLTSAVAMATLRNDIEGTESPLVEYIPGSPWPPVDPDMLGHVIRLQYHEESRFWTCVYFLLGLTRSPRHTTLYNAARPFGVLGGVSDEEVGKLQQARGPYAKVGLCTMWLQEYITREHLNGSVGAIHPALMSRLYQFTSDGMIGYNQSRKIAYVPFPFVHEQGTIFVLCVLVVLFPVLYYSFVNRLALACIMNFVTVMCFVGLHEVARELENPFWNAPNDLPLTTFQAQFNEALVTTCFGFHPDAYWEVPTEEEQEETLSEVKEEESLSTVARQPLSELPVPGQIQNHHGGVRLQYGVAFSMTLLNDESRRTLNLYRLGQKRKRTSFRANGFGPFTLMHDNLILEILAIASPDVAVHISGCKGAGKTTLLAQIYEKLSEVQANTRVLFFVSTADIQLEPQLSDALMNLMQSCTKAYVLLDETQEISLQGSGLIHLPKNTIGHNVTVIGAGISHADCISSRFGYTFTTERLFSRHNSWKIKDVLHSLLERARKQAPSDYCTGQVGS